MQMLLRVAGEKNIYDLVELEKDASEIEQLAELEGQDLPADSENDFLRMAENDHVLTAIALCTHVITSLSDWYLMSSGILPPQARSCERSQPLSTSLFLISIPCKNWYAWFPGVWLNEISAILP